MVELNLIKLLLNKDNYEEALSKGLVMQDFPKELQPIFSVISNWFGLNDGVISVADLSNLVFALNNSNKDKQFYEEVLSNLETLDVSEGTSKTLLTSLLQKKKLKELSLAAYEAYEGKLEFEKFLPLLTGFDLKQTIVDDEDEFVTDDLEELVDAIIDTPGLRWRLQTLNRMLGSLRKGNFGFIFARPETGKTTFLASEVSFMCTQLKDEDGPIVWIANEEPAGNVKLRVYQAWFGIDLPTLLSNKPYWSAKFKEESRGKLLLPTNQNMDKRDIERLCKKYTPSLLILDQLSKINGFEADRYDLELGAATTWSRDLAKEYCPVIAIHQADGNAEGQMWLNMGHVANAKTAMQADADWILGIGKQNKDGYESIRYLHLSKNKLIGDSDTEPQHRHGKLEVLLKPEIARYEDLY